MNEYYTCSLKVTTPFDFPRLQEFYNQYFEEQKILIFNNKIEAKISIETSLKGLILLIKAEFNLIHSAPLDWVARIHKQFPTLAIYLSYQDSQNEYLGKLYTGDITDIEDIYENFSTPLTPGLVHQIRKLRWYDIEY